MKTVSIYKQVFDNEKSIIFTFRQMLEDARANKIEWTNDRFYRIQSYLNHKLDRAYENHSRLYMRPSDSIRDKFWRLVFGVSEDAELPIWDRMGALVVITEKLEPEPDNNWRVSSFLHYNKELIAHRKYVRINFQCSYRESHRAIYRDALKSIDDTLARFIAIDVEIASGYGEILDTLPIWIAIDNAS